MLLFPQSVHLRMCGALLRLHSTADTSRRVLVCKFVDVYIAFEMRADWHLRLLGNVWRVSSFKLNDDVRMLGSLKVL